MALAVDPRIEALLAAARGQVAGGNAGRQQSALLAALGLTGAGLYERSDAVQQGSAAAGFSEAPDLMNLTYGVKQGPQGFAFRNAANQINSSAAARGVGMSTGTSNQNLLAQRDLFGRIQQALQALSAGQASSLTQQGAGLGQLGQSIADIRFEQAREAAAAPPPVPAAPTLTPAVQASLTAAKTPAAGSSGSGDKGYFREPKAGTVVKKPPVKKIPTRPLVRR